MKRILIHKYELLKLLGEGSTGRVYLANDLHLNRLAAIKESNGSPIGDAGYEKEAELLKNLHHPGLPEIFDFFRQEEQTYLVMEYVEGVSLREYLDRNGKPDQQQAVSWALELAEILMYLHNCRPSIIYRDLKPANIIVCPNGKLRLIDLGAAICYACGQEEDLFCAGTVGYCPIGHWRGGYTDASWDIYGVGAILHEMLSGINPTLPPYERRPLREYDSSIPRGLEELVEDCTDFGKMEKNGFLKLLRGKIWYSKWFAGSKQYGTMEQVAEGLRGYTKQDRQRNLWWRLRKIPVYGMALLSCGWFFLPLLHGVPERDIPFPFLYKPLAGFLICFLLYRVLLHGKKSKSRIKKLEKSVCLTEKKYPGLFLLLVGIGACLAALPWHLQVPALPLTEQTAEHQVVYAGEENSLWVEMRDDQYRKLLLKDGAVYETDTQIRFELPAGRMPEGELSLQMIAVGEEGEVYTSRVFLLKKK